METLARNGPYNKLDNRNETPAGGVIEGPVQQFTKVNVEQVIEWGKREKDWKDNVRLSTDAGLYLCEWTFFTSLRESAKEDSSHATVLFIHVPQIGEDEGKMSLEAMTQIVSEIIEGVITNSS
jgi:pyrrolidone-carboxylate peptidase